MKRDELHPGELRMELIEGLAKITRADPCIRITDEWLREMAKPTQPLTDWDPSSRALTIRDHFGAEFIYRVGAYLPERNAWQARWPD